MMMVFVAMVMTGPDCVTGVGGMMIVCDRYEWYDDGVCCHGDDWT